MQKRGQVATVSLVQKRPVLKMAVELVDFRHADLIKIRYNAICLRMIRLFSCLTFRNGDENCH